MNTQRQRLDIILTERGFAPSRSRARDMVLRGCVSVGGEQISKAGHLLPRGADIAINDPASAYASRAALKLVAGLDEAQIDVTGKRALDLGASTGGFTQVLLERGAKHVVAVDVGHSQMVDELREDERVTCIEGLNARNTTLDDIGTPVDIIVSDMSFVSLRIAAESSLLLAVEGADAVLLVKPQFEVGRENIGKGGLANDETVIARMLDDIQDWFAALPGWRVTHLLPSPIEGGDGNREYLLCGSRDE